MCVFFLFSERTRTHHTGCRRFTCVCFEGGGGSEKRLLEERSFFVVFLSNWFFISICAFGGEFPSVARPLQSPVFCGTSSCQTTNTPLPSLTPISPTAPHAVSDSRVPKMVQYHSTPPPRGLSNDCLFLAPLRALSRFSLRTTVLPS